MVYTFLHACRYLCMLVNNLQPCRFTTFMNLVTKQHFNIISFHIQACISLISVTWTWVYIIQIFLY